MVNDAAAFRSPPVNRPHRHSLAFCHQPFDQLVHFLHVYFLFSVSGRIPGGQETANGIVSSLFSLLMSDRIAGSAWVAWKSCNFSGFPCLLLRQDAVRLGTCNVIIWIHATNCIRLRHTLKVTRHVCYMMPIMVLSLCARNTIILEWMYEFFDSCVLSSHYRKLGKGCPSANADADARRRSHIRKNKGRSKVFWR